MSKEPAGPLLWIVSVPIGIGIGATAGLLACVLARPKDERQLLPDPDLDSAKRADEREVRTLRYLLGVLFAFLGAVIGAAVLLDTVHAVITRWFGVW